MLEQRLTFAGLDLDTEPHLLPQGSYPHALNVRTYNALTQASGVIESLPGHQSFASAMPDTGTSEVIGGCEAPELEATFYFVWNSLGRHCICRVHTRTLVASVVLEWSGLNLSRDHRIHSAVVVASVLYWTDKYNEPRKLDLTDLAARPDTYAAMLTDEPHFLDLLRRGPQYVLDATIDYDAGRPTQQTLPRASLQFTYRYIYWRGEPSIFADWSAALPFSPIRPYRNVVHLSVPAAEQVPRLVKRIEVAVREGDTGAVRLIGAYSPDTRTFPAYYGDVYGDAVDAATLVKPYDYVPQLSGALSYADDRLELADNAEGYDRGRATLALSLTDLALDADQSFPAGAGGPVYAVTIGVDTGDGTATSTSANDPENFLGYVYVESYGPGGGFDGARFRPVITRDFPGTGAENYAAHRLVKQTISGSATVTEPNPMTEGMLDYHAPVLSYDDLKGFVKRAQDYYNTRDNGTASAGLYLAPTAPFTLRGGVGSQGYRRVLKTGSIHRVGVQFFDHHGRTPGVAEGVTTIRNGGDLDATPLVLDASARWPQGVDKAQLKAGIAWSLLSGEADIPAWATSYQLVRSRDLSAAAFLQGVSCDAGYGNRLADGTYQQQAQVYGSGYAYTFLHAENLNAQGLGYSYAAGDRVRVWARPATLAPVAGSYPQVAAQRPLPAVQLVDLELVAVVGSWLVVPLVDVGSRNAKLFESQALGSGRDALDTPRIRVPFEVYTPYAVSEQEPLYACGPRYPVIRTQGVPAYGTSSGELPGDAYVVERQDHVLYGSQATAHKVSTEGDFVRTHYHYYYFALGSDGTLAHPEALSVSYFPLGGGLPTRVCAMNPNPENPYVWERGLGRITAEVLTAQVQDRFNAIRFSNPFTGEAEGNGLSSFEPLNEGLMPREHGRIRKLQPVGSNLLAIGELGAEAVYLGKTQLRDEAGQTLLSLSDRVIGSHRPLAGGGCQHPETVREHNGYVYWWNCLTGVAVRYANDGLTEISGYGLTGWFAQRRRSQLPAAPRPMAWYSPLYREYVLHPGLNRVETTQSQTAAVRDQWVRVPAAADRQPTDPALTLTSWAVASGAAVTAGQVVATVTSGDTNAYSPVDGHTTLVAAVGAVVTKGQVVATVQTAGGQAVSVQAPIAGTVTINTPVGGQVYAGITGLVRIQGPGYDLAAPADGVLDRLATLGATLVPGQAVAGVTRTVATATVVNTAGPGDLGPAVVFCEAANRWPAFRTLAPDYTLPAGSSAISFVGSAAYLHDALPADSNSLLGTHYPAEVGLAPTAGKDAVTVFETLLLTGSPGWEAPLIEAPVDGTNPQGQRSHLDAADFEAQEGKHYAAFLRDELTPNVAAPLIEGDALRSTRLSVVLRHPVGTASPAPAVQLRAATVGMSPSS